MLGWMALGVAVSLPVLCLLCFPTVLLRPLPDSQSKDRRYIHIPFPHSKLPRTSLSLFCLCLKVEVFVWHRIDCVCVMSPPPHMQRMQEPRRTCCCLLHILTMNPCKISWLEFAILRVVVSADLAELFSFFPFVLWRNNRGALAVAQVLWPDFAVLVQAWWILDSSGLSVNRFVEFDRQIFQETFSLDCNKSPIGSRFPPRSVSILSFGSSLRWRHTWWWSWWWRSFVWAGNADGFGARRKLEMVAACSVLKVDNNSLPFPVLVDSLGFRF